MSLYSSVSDGTKYLSLSSSLIDHNSAYTTMFWVYLVVDANDYGHFWAACVSADDYQNADWIGVGADGTTLRLSSYEASESFVDGDGTSLSTGTWYHVAAVRESTTSCKAYLNGVLDITITSPNVSTRSSAGDERMNRLNTAYGCQARYAHFKQWQAALTVDEIKAEMNSILPLRTTNLNRWTPMVDVTATDADNSWFGSSWTPTGTWATDDGPGVPYGAPVLFQPYAAAGGTTYYQSNAGSITMSGAYSDVVTFGKSVAGSITGTGVVNKKISVTRSGSSTASGSITKKTSKSLAGSISLSGIVNKVISVSRSGVITATGAVTEAWNTFISNSGSSTFLGALSTRFIAAGSLSSSLRQAFTFLRRYIGRR